MASVELGRCLFLLSDDEVMDMAKYEFDDGNPKSIEEYAKQLLGKSFYDVIGWKIERDCNQVTAEQVDSYANKHRKGGLGNLLENVYFNYKSNSDPHADFVKAGVELKVTPYEKNKKGELRAGERLVLTMISYNSPVEEDFFKSVDCKCKLNKIYQATISVEYTLSRKVSNSSSGL